MRARHPSTPRADAQIARQKLDACDEDLSQIAGDMEELAEELGRLRTSASPLVQWLSERNALLADKEFELNALDEARLSAQRHAETAAATLQTTRDLLDQRDEQLTAANLEIDSLRSIVDDRDRQLAHTQRDLQRPREPLEHRDSPLVEQRTSVASVSDGTREYRGAERCAPVAEPYDDQIGHVQFVPFPEGYRLVPSPQRASRPGEVLEIDGRQFVVTRVGRSPFPADNRRCAFLQSSGSTA